eukprot:361689-Prorocentrum_minimum.AAC.4
MVQLLQDILDSKELPPDLRERVQAAFPMLQPPPLIAVPLVHWAPQAHAPSGPPLPRAPSSGAINQGPLPPGSP